MYFRMANYKKFLVQQQTHNGSSYGDLGDVVDTQATFGIVCQECPFKYLPESKDLPRRDWPDEHGEDVFIPSDGIKFQAYDMDVKFLYVGKESEMPVNLKRFMKFMYGHMNIINRSFVTGDNLSKNVTLKIFDEYTSIGRIGCIVKSVDDELYFFNDSNIDAIAQFKVKFRVTDPVTGVTLVNDKLNEVANG